MNVSEKSYPGLKRYITDKCYCSHERQMHGVVGSIVNGTKCNISNCYCNNFKLKENHAVHSTR